MGRVNLPTPRHSSEFALNYFKLCESIHETQPAGQPLCPHPVLLDEPLAPHVGQVAVLPGHLRLALLQQHRQLAPLHLHFKMQKVKGGICLNVLVYEK